MFNWGHAFQKRLAMTTDVFALLEASTAGRPDASLTRRPNASEAQQTSFSLHLMIPYHKLLQHTRREANPNDLCIAALTNPRAAFLKLSSASTRERLSVESCMLRMCRQHSDLRGSGPILASSKTTSNFWIFCILAKPAARPRQPLSPRRSDVLGSNPKQPRKLYHGNRAHL